MNIPLSPYVPEPENLVSRDGFSRSRPALACLFFILRLNLVLTHGIPPDFRAASSTALSLVVNINTVVVVIPCCTVQSV